MQKLIFTIVVFIISVSSSFAQQANLNEQESLFKFGFFGPNIEYETSINTNMTLQSETGLSVGFGYGGNAIGWIFNYGLYAKVSPRLYYNLDSRLQNGKSIEDYSANYFSFVSMAYLNSILSNENDPNQYILGPTWGLQRNIGSNWYLNFEVGPGISISKDETIVVPIIGFDIGIKL